MSIKNLLHQLPRKCQRAIFRVRNTVFYILKATSRRQKFLWVQFSLPCSAGKCPASCMALAAFAFLLCPVVFPSSPRPPASFSTCLAEVCAATSESTLADATKSNPLWNDGDFGIPNGDESRPPITWPCAKVEWTMFGNTPVVLARTRTHANAPPFNCQKLNVVPSRRNTTETTDQGEDAMRQVIAIAECLRLFLSG